mgnify:CR=1 FL=1
MHFGGVCISAGPLGSCSIEFMTQIGRKEGKTVTLYYQCEANKGVDFVRRCEAVTKCGEDIFSDFV